MKRRVAITGIGMLTPIGISKEEYWSALIEGKSGISRVTHFDPRDFPCQIAGEIKNFNPIDYIDSKKVRRQDRFVQFAIVASKDAIKDSGLELTKEDPKRIGVIFGSGIGGLSSIEKQFQILSEKGPRRVSPFLIPMMITNMAAGEIAITLNLQGPNYAISSACATSAHAIGDSLRLIECGDADVILTGGSEAAITPLGYAGFCSIKAFSLRNNEPEKASRPFDRERDGFVMSEGAGVVILEEWEHAASRGARIYGELAGYGATDDAYHITAPSPDGDSAAMAIKNALDDAGINPSEIDYINAHGTSTQLNDKIETLAIKKVFGDYAYKIPISSTKSMTGHLLGAAGAIELISILLSMQKSLIHPTINYEYPDPDCDLDYVPNKPREKEIETAISNSLGFGGHNATLVVKKA